MICFVQPGVKNRLSASSYFHTHFVYIPSFCENSFSENPFMSHSKTSGIRHIEQVHAHDTLTAPTAPFKHHTATQPNTFVKTKYQGEITGLMIMLNCSVTINQTLELGASVIWLQCGLALSGCGDKVPQSKTCLRATLNDAALLASYCTWLPFPMMHCIPLIIIQYFIISQNFRRQ